METTTLKEPYSTTDTSLAAFLYTEGFRIIDIDYSNDRAQIIFENGDQKIHDMERLYYIGKAEVEPSLYSRNYKRLSRVLRNRIPWVEGVVNA